MGRGTKHRGPVGFGPGGPKPNGPRRRAVPALAPPGPNPMGRGVEAVPALARGALAYVDFPLGAFPRNLPCGDYPYVRLG